jgi:hypothetical protein
MMKKTNSSNCTIKTPAIKRKAALLEAAPLKKKSLLPAPLPPTASPMTFNSSSSSTAMSATFVTMKDFSNFKTVLNGYVCHFFKKSSYKILKFSAEKMMLGKFDNLTLFEIKKESEEVLASKIDAVLNAYPLNLLKVNPFTLTEFNFDVVDKKPAFIRISPTCNYWVKEEQGKIREILKSDLTQGKCFSGRVALLIKGVTISPDGSRMSPMISVCQLLEDKRLHEVEQAWTKECILDWVSQDEEEEEQSAEVDELFNDAVVAQFFEQVPTYSPADALANVHGQRPRLTQNVSDASTTDLFA